MKMATKLIFEASAQNALKLIKEGVPTENACKKCSNDVVNAGALRAYLETHFLCKSL